MGLCAWARIEKGRRYGRTTQVVSESKPTHGGGVCGGLADYFNIDVTVIRVLFLILSVFGGTGLLIYLVMWIIVPDVSKA
jgi:phage shock protein PspC (stress-responsive transcriptional regulator)